MSIKKIIPPTKFLAIAIFTLAIFQFKITKAQSFDWATFAYSGGSIFGKGIERDTWGNTYAIGTIGANLAFPDTNINGIVGVGKRMFVVKYDNFSKRQWVRVFAGTWDATAACVKTDAAGNVFITGGKCKLSDTIDLSAEQFVARLNPANGEVLWAQKTPGVF